MENLLEKFALAHTQLVRLNGQIHRSTAAGEGLNTQVELKLAPGQLPSESGGNAFQLAVTLSCTGRDAKHQPVFELECVLNAIYRQMSGDNVTYETFAENHSTLVRQLYPLIHHQLRPVLAQFGLHQVQLPHEIVYRQGEARPEQLH